VRENRQGRYISLVYGRPCAVHNDHIEKKPFFHVYPGSMAFSIATVGCNLHCKFCQNWAIAQAPPGKYEVEFHAPEAIAAAAHRAGSRVVAYTYSEPTIFYEYMVDCARAARDRGLGNVVVSNGFVQRQPLEELCTLVTAIKIDLKAFSPHFYRNVCAGELEPVKETLKVLAGAEVWFEIVVLIIPTLNDAPDEIKRMAAWIVKELGPEIPVHFTRFVPRYKILNLPPTPRRTLDRTRQIAVSEGCRFVYGGNMPGTRGENTYCPECGTCLVDRYGHSSRTIDLRENRCPKCGRNIPGVWS
jgi:pyruvate formate lyase activating enzyme